MKYTACIAYDVSYYAEVTLEAECDEEALEIARKMARDHDGRYDLGYAQATGQRVVTLDTIRKRNVAEDVEA